jgi:hypothetical protein
MADIVRKWLLLVGLAGGVVLNAAWVAFLAYQTLRLLF